MKTFVIWKVTKLKITIVYWSFAWQKWRFLWRHVHIKGGMSPPKMRGDKYKLNNIYLCSWIISLFLFFSVSLGHKKCFLYFFQNVSTKHSYIHIPFHGVLRPLLALKSDPMGHIMLPTSMGTWFNVPKWPQLFLLSRFGVLPKFRFLVMNLWKVQSD